MGKYTSNYYINLSEFMSAYPDKDRLDRFINRQIMDVEYECVKVEVRYLGKPNPNLIANVYLLDKGAILKSDIISNPDMFTDRKVLEKRLIALARLKLGLLDTVAV